jgi:AAA domain
MVISAVGPRQGGDLTGEHEHLQLTTLGGWRRLVTEVPAVPGLLPGPVWSGLDAGKRACYDDGRIDHHSRLLVVQTPTIREVINSGRRLIQLNKNAHYGRCGLMVSGPARTGKTTALTQLGKTVEVIHQRRHPRSSGDIPVVYITVPPAATPKMIAMEFARFFGLPLTHRANITDIADAVCGVSLDAHVTLVEVDELHNLNTATRAGAEASETLKYLTERIPATFIYAGISLERGGLLSGTRGEQIAGRFGMVRTGPFGPDQQWTALIAALEDSLRLHHHKPGTVPGLDRYLHQRTHGMIGSLLWLIRSAAINAVLDGTEKITKRPWTTSKPTSPPNPRACPPRDRSQNESSRSSPCARPGCRCAPSPDSSATVRKPSATTCTSAGHPESEPSRGQACSPTSSPTTAASDSPRTLTCGPAACSAN